MKKKKEKYTKHLFDFLLTKIEQGIIIVNEDKKEPFHRAATLYSEMVLHKYSDILSH